MKILLEAVKFNHEPTSATTDAFNIRKNETQVVIVPEWRRGISVNPEDSPAAYALHETRGNQLTIRAKFKCSDLSSQTIKVRAVDAQINHLSDSSGCFGAFPSLLLRPLLRDSLQRNILGEVMERDVSLIEGESNFETFKLEGTTIWDAGVSVNDISWCWQFSLNAKDWTDFATTNHRIFTTLCMPTRPWEPRSLDGSNTQLPWAEVLDYACRWAAGALNPDDAATRITQAVNGLGPSVLRFEPDGGSTHYTDEFPPRFDCADFLRLLQGSGNQKGRKVNCDDCAAIVATFANVVGCDLNEALMGFDFDLNHHQRIGVPAWIENGKFVYHTVAWEGACGEDDELFDAYVHVDGEGDPAIKPRKILLPTNLRFGRLKEFEYRYRLVTAAHQKMCVPLKGNTIRRRRLGYVKPPDGLVQASEVFLEPFKRHYAYETWADVKAPGDSIFIWKFFLHANALLPWQLKHVQFIDIEDRLPGLQSFWSGTEGQAGAVLRIDAYQCLSLRDARHVLLTVLSKFHLPGMVFQEKSAFGDVVFKTQGNFTILFARAKLVFLLRNIGEMNVSVENIAKFIDEHLTSEPSVNREAASVQQLFYFDAQEAVVGDKVVLKETPAPPFDRRCLYKFFSDSGDVSLQDGCLIYQPTCPGLQALRIYAIDDYGEVRSQLLQLKVR